MGVVASDAAANAKPAITFDKHDHLYCAYHTAADHLRIWVSKDYGATWTSLVDKSDLAYRFPRLAFRHDALYLACSVPTGGNRVRVFHSDDFGANLSGVLSVSDVVEQWPALRVDRRGIVHLVYLTAGNVTQHRWSKRPGTTTADADWTNVETLDIGPAPAYDLGTVRGYAAEIDGLVSERVYVYETAETYGAPLSVTALDGPVAFEEEQYPAVLVDHHEHVWIVGLLASGGGGIGGVVQGGGGGLGEL